MHKAWFIVEKRHMEHHLRLHNTPFNNISLGIKKVESRLLDEKRQQIHIWDTIIFTNRQHPQQTLHCKVVNLFFYKTFKDMFQGLRTEYWPWYSQKELEESATQYYTPEDEEHYGVVGLKIELLKSPQEINLDSYTRDSDTYIKNTINTQTATLIYWQNKVLKDLPYDAKILEVWTGTWRDADYMESLGYTIQRTDAAESLISYNKQRGKEISHYNILTDRLTEQYDLIFANAVLIHLTHEQWQNALKYRKEHLLPHGKISRSTQEGTWQERRESKWMKRCFYYRSAEEVEKVMKELWYKNVDVRVDEPEPGRRRIRCIATL